MAFLHILRRLAVFALVIAGVALLVLIGQGFVADRGARDLDPGDPIGPSTRARIARLDGPGCERLLRRAGVAYHALPRRDRNPHCGIDDAVTWAADGSRRIDYAPAAPALACPLAASLSLWEWDVVQPAAVRSLGTTVAQIDHYGSYACRRLYGRASGDWSEHARAAAIDVAGFRLADGRRITVAADWHGTGPKAAFLHAVRDGGCRLFGTTLSPDYNAAHRDHLHLDVAQRGGWGFCR